MSGIYGRGAKGRATRLHSLVVRARGACERCGSRQNLQCAHIVARRYNNTRTDETNAWCLCAGCHLRLTEWPNEHVSFAWSTIGEAAYQELRERALSDRKWKDADWVAECTRLQALLDEVAA